MSTWEEDRGVVRDDKDGGSDPETQMLVVGSCRALTSINLCPLHMLSPLTNIIVGRACKDWLATLLYQSMIMSLLGLKYYFQANQ
jgi:hypothetical protein